MKHIIYDFLSEDSNKPYRYGKEGFLNYRFLEPPAVVFLRNHNR